ncbi:MAG: hypothetical protein ACI9VR_003455, partial [Cognaticolwellia sp.]
MRRALLDHPLYAGVAEGDLWTIEPPTLRVVGPGGAACAGPTNAVRRDQAVRVNLTMPVTRIGFGPFSFDPVEQMIGPPLVSLLESLMVAPVSRRPSLAGPAVEVYPLALPPGEGATIPLGQFGFTTVRRLSFSARGVSGGLRPLDAELNLPPELYSFGLRRRAA